ncbi:MAG: FlgD immunoglobulin-like domain containing protein [Candidatus Celaenobacter polaris]|nr:FlgD immunoglobulin-like domain containing protein [Candidatus Celaenobacter polaris]
MDLKEFVQERIAYRLQEKVKIIIKIFCVVVIVFSFVNCSGRYVKNKLVNEETSYPSKFQASISSDFDDGDKLCLDLFYRFPKESSYSGHELIFNAHNYGKYWTFNPYIKNPVMLLDLFSQGVGGRMSLPKQNEYQLIFFVDGDKNEFNVNIQDNVVKVSPDQQSHIVFDPAAVNLLPENIITISYENELSDTSFDVGLHEKLIDLGCIPQQLPLGNYYKYELTGYTENDKFAHTERMNLELYYFFKITRNYEKVRSLLKSYFKILNEGFSEYDYDYNFNMNKKIEEEKNPEQRIVNLQGPGFPKELQFSDLHEKEVAEISFSLDKPQKVKIGIFDVKGNNIQEVELTCSSSGNFTYTWDGKMANGNQAAKGVYFYKLFINNIQIQLKKILLY